MIALSGKKVREDFPWLQLPFLPLQSFGREAKTRGGNLEVPTGINLDFSQSGAQCGIVIFHSVRHLKVTPLPPYLRRGQM